MQFFVVCLEVVHSGRDHAAPWNNEGFEGMVKAGEKTQQCSGVYLKVSILFWMMMMMMMMMMMTMTMTKMTKMENPGHPVPFCTSIIGLCYAAKRSSSPVVHTQQLKVKGSDLHCKDGVLAPRSPKVLSRFWWYVEKLVIVATSRPVRMEVGDPSFEPGLLIWALQGVFGWSFSRVLLLWAIR